MRVALVCLALLSATAATGGVFTIDEGAIDDAPFRLAVPEPWDGGVLILAHGWRPASAPVVAVLDPDDPVISTYLEGGWLVAATGYRRNGWILEEAAEDLMALLEYVNDEYGYPRRVVLEGTSLGANIGLFMAEAENPVVDGVLAMAADPAAEGPDGPTPWTWAPSVPVLMMSNRDEYAWAEDFAARVGGEAIRPALWVLGRDGHVNLNAAERWEAHAALQGWVEGGVRPRGWVGEPFDATVVPEPLPSVARPRDRGLEGRVLAVDPVFGNLVTDLVEADLEAVARSEGSRFLVRGFGTEEKIEWGSTYSDVKPDRLVAFVDADGQVRIAVNRGNAADRLSLDEGESILILPSGRKKNDPRR